MNGLDEQVLLKALARWVGKTQCPYTNPSDLNEHAMTLHSNCTHSWLEFKMAGKNAVELTCVHTLFQNTKPTELGEVRHEIQQFNQLMETVMLPVIVWENPANNQFQLLWQEHIQQQTELPLVQRMFEQSMFMANALESRMGWAVNSVVRPMHH